MSFSLTTQQFLDGSKDVTRRNGWLFLKPGDRVRGVKKAMGLKRGEKIQPLGIIEIVDVRREQLQAITDDDVRREGFPGESAAWFVEHYRAAMKCDPDAEVTRIEFKHVEAADGNQPGPAR